MSLGSTPDRMLDGLNLAELRVLRQRFADDVEVQREIDARIAKLERFDTPLGVNTATMLVSALHAIAESNTLGNPPPKGESLPALPAADVQLLRRVEHVLARLDTPSSVTRADTRTLLFDVRWRLKHAQGAPVRDAYPAAEPQTFEELSNLPHVVAGANRLLTELGPLRHLAAVPRCKVHGDRHVFLHNAECVLTCECGAKKP